MRHGNRVKKLGRKKEHRKALLNNLCRALFIHEKIRTTLPKAKQARRLAERLIEFAKQNTLAAKRTIYRYIPDHKLVKVICEELGPKFMERHGGYTRIYRLGPRLGDGAEMAIIELVEQSDEAILTTRRKLIQHRSVQIEKSKKEKQKKTKPKKEKREPVAAVKKKVTTKKEAKAIKKKAKKEKKAKKREQAKKTKKKR
ncbi:50S ribosomal protein L17 [candidate division WOR-3 bacterium]|nr:50S ribosomal protein L17 [candidate division WOR-3 bacterium]